jgi:hypothetical protein
MDAIGAIYLEMEDGREYCWSVSCHPSLDNIETLRAHALKWKPSAVFIGAEIWRSKEARSDGE